MKDIGLMTNQCLFQAHARKRAVMRITPRGEVKKSAVMFSSI